MATYTPFIKVELSHGYFGHAKIDMISIVPTKSTAEFMKQAELLHRPDAEGIQLFHSENSASLVASLPDTDKLTFFLQQTDPLFSIVTDLTIPRHDQGSLWFVNEDPEDDSENILLEHQVKETSQDTESTTTLGEVLPANLIGIIEIDFDPTGGLGVRNFGIRFEARPASWRYQIVSGEDVNLGLCQVKSTQKDIRFSDLRMKKLDNGSVAFEAKTISPIPMSQRFSFSNRLVGEGLGIDQSISLPNGDPAMVTMDEEGNFSVSLYVYL